MILKDNGVTIGGKHSYNDYGMILTSKSISAPEAQTKTVTVPGRNGVIDMSEVLTGDIRYDSREIKMEFYTDKEPLEWSAFVSELQNAFQGQKVQIVFDDDLSYYWLGRVSIEFANDGRRGTVSITATVDPYKYSVTSSAEDWLWDPFDFETSVINEMAEITVNGSKSVTLICTDGWENPVITSTAAMTVAYDGSTYSITAGTQTVYDIILAKGENTLTFTGTGTVTIMYKGGML